jgi:hypothetical protein
MGLLGKVMDLARGEHKTFAGKAEFYRQWNDRIDTFCRSLGYNSSAHTVTALELIGVVSDWGTKPVTDGIILDAFKRADAAIKRQKS